MSGSRSLSLFIRSLNSNLNFFVEFLYDDIFRVWECIWAARICSSKHFVLFIALALLKSYR